MAARMATGGGLTGAIYTSNSDDLESRPLVKGEDGEYEVTRNLNNRQVLDKQKQMLQDQDKHLDEIGAIVSGLRYENQNFNQEVTLQNKMLEKVNDDIDKNQAKMV